MNSTASSCSDKIQTNYVMSEDLFFSNHLFTFMYEIAFIYVLVYIVCRDMDIAVMI